MPVLVSVPLPVDVAAAVAVTEIMAVDVAVAVGFRRQVALFDTQRLRADHHLGLATLWQPAGIYVAYRRLYHASFSP